MTVVHHDEIRRRLRDRYTPADLRALRALLDRAGTLTFAPLATGLYPAVAAPPEGAAADGYGNVWVRDNVHVALALREVGQAAAANAVLAALAEFFGRHRRRFEDVIEGRADPDVPADRPHIRLDGQTLDELPERWAHAQNDALGAFLWLYCGQARRGELAPDGELLARFAHYFAAIRYWQDADSGHWEERRKVQASSIGVVTAGLRALRDLLAGPATPACRLGDRPVTDELLAGLIAEGERALAATLPAECAQPDPKLARRYDAALLFLVHPFAVVDDAMADRIVDDVLGHLQGAHGIRRYLADSYWTADFADRRPAEDPDADEDEQLDARDAIARPGEEAQWTLFDPVVSVIAGRRYLQTRVPADLDLQVHHLNRALGQLTGPHDPAGGLRCPEAWCLVGGRYVQNGHTPLLWTQANLLQALLAMERSVGPAR